MFISGIVITVLSLTGIVIAGLLGDLAGAVICGVFLGMGLVFIILKDEL